MKIETDCFGMDPKEIEAARRALTENEQVAKSSLEKYLSQIKEWEYCYCANCKTIRFSSDLEATEEGVRCSKCKGYNLEAPGWVRCPHHKDSIVKCPRSGKGIVKSKYQYECHDHCYFRTT
ncbi:hypothetical protein [Pelotomaculum propionicicum]|uniref:Uncharacterized protein n=1 Tax=Pelotomaculum propionicicum TaxID=258475 RepID=A0A4Y7RTW2_9FIRM|nr:hypothetical protein [Pelotomaculum propionicicum]NLI13354.1 hypothetical protein [Peptococcaceae bacterium]TEB12415.1 hypothetical protein Pmgp_01032 [Pelotomaculum propionicicum]